MLDQARRWYLGDPSASPVKIRARPDNSVTGVTLESPIYGTPDGAPIELPRSFHDYLKTTEVNAVTLRFVRNGLWYNPTPESVATGSASTSTALSATFSNNLNVVSPVDISWNPTSDSTASNDKIRGALLYGTSSSDFTLITPPTSSDLTTWVLLNVGAVTPYYAGNTRTQGTIAVANTEINVDCPVTSTTDSTYVYVVARANTAPVTVWVELKANGVITPYWRSSAVTLPGDSSPQVVSLGVAPTKSVSTVPIIYATSATAGATIDVDFILFQSDYGTRSGGFYYSTVEAPLGNTGTRLNLATVINNPLSYTTPFVYRNYGSATFSTFRTLIGSYQGSTYIQSSNTGIAFFPIAFRDIGGTSDLFTIYTTSAMSTQITARRYTAYVTLE